MTGFLHALPSKPRIHAESALRLELANGSRVISLPGVEKTTRGYSKANLIILDEASRIEDSLISSSAADEGGGEGRAVRGDDHAVGAAGVLLRAVAVD